MILLFDFNGSQPKNNYFFLSPCAWIREQENNDKEHLFMMAFQHIIRS